MTSGAWWLSWIESESIIAEEARDIFQELHYDLEDIGDGYELTDLRAIILEGAWIGVIQSLELGEVGRAHDVARNITVLEDKWRRSE